MVCLDLNEVSHMDATLTARELILRPELQTLVPLSDTTVWRLERQGKFPKRIPISTKRVAWRRSQVESWLRAREAECEPLDAA
jgi:prophage regulatory protein